MCYLKRIALLAAVVCILPACTARGIDEDRLPAPLPSPEKVFGWNLPESAVDPLLLNVLFDEKTAGELESITGDDGYVQLPAVKSFDARRIVRMRRLFPDAGRFEERTRKEGLHRWYEVYYDSSVPITKAASGWVDIPGVEMVELNPLIHIVGGSEIVELTKPLTASATSSAYPFNDPMLPSQWHYYNIGVAASSAGGCDINIFPVWKYVTTGSPDVIVGVVDGGIDYSHEDLAANMWHNPEQQGDAVYGYNFATNSYSIHPENHGTHVAGIIGAVNNNGIGVAGTAGGDAAAGLPGVKLMSCQIFDGETRGNGAAAIKWSADHGAVVSQNSWGYDNTYTTPKSLIDAVDYFIKYAGVDENGVQTGPMRGGIVIFAAGNEEKSTSGNSYEPIFNVAAVGADYRKAYYSNFGDWVDIAAPGGDAKKGNQLLSTMVGNKYGLHQGTSMACPQISGIAALIISQFQRDGLTPDEVSARLLQSATPVNQFNKSVKLGAGLANAWKALASSGGGLPPEAPSDLKLSVSSNNMKVSVKVPEDKDDGRPSSIIIYYHLINYSEISPNLMFAKLYLDDEKPGDTIEATLTGLDFNTVLYVSAAAEDLAGNKSHLTEVQTVMTGFNTPPVIEALGPLQLTLKPWQTGSLDFKITDADGHFYLIDLDSPAAGITLDTLVRDLPKVVVSGPDTPSGNYSATLKATDIYGAQAVQQMSFTVLQNHSPVVIASAPDIILSSAGESRTIDLAQFIRDEDGEQLSYSVSSSDENVAIAGISGNSLTLSTQGYGTTTVTITAADACKEACSFSFRILVRDASRPIDLYPNPVVDKLHIRPGTDGRYAISIYNKAGAEMWSASVEAGPFNPAVVDFSVWSGGIYYVRIAGTGVDGQFTIAKK